LIVRTKNYEKAISEVSIEVNTKGPWLKTLATLRIVKGPEDHGVLVVGFDVAVTAQEKGEDTDKVAGSVGAILQVVGVKIGAESVSTEMQTTSNTHRIIFSIPLAITNW
jgi:hypothetical protein